MSHPEVIDLEGLLAPLAEEQPTGSDPREDASPRALYYSVKDARTAARSAERSNVDPDAPAPEGWSTVLSDGLDLLQTQAKDLEIAAWITEALVRLEGFPGLRDGLRLLAGLIDHYWEVVHPLPDEDGAEGRLTAVAALSGAGVAGTLAQTLRTLPLVGIARPFSIWNYDQAVEVEKITEPERKAARLAAGSPTMEMFNEGLLETAARDLFETLETIDEALEALSALTEAVDRAAGYDAPSFSALREVLEQITGSIRHFGAEKLAAHAKALETAAREDASSAFHEESDAAFGDPSAFHDEDLAADDAAFEIAATGGGAVQTGGFANREDALRAVLRLADYFRRTEPQAPISYTLIEAVRRARMPLLDLLRELTNDSSAIHQFTTAAGMRIESRGEMSEPSPDYPSPSFEDHQSESYGSQEHETYQASEYRQSDGW